MRLFIVEPLTAVGQALCQNLRNELFSCEGTVHTIDEALPQLDSGQIDALLITSAAVPDVASLTRIAERLAGMRLVLLDDTLDFVRAAFAVEHGLAGYLTKDQPLAELQAALATVCRGERAFAPRVQERLIFHGSRLELAHGEKSANYTPLTTRETQVLILIAKGHSVREVAAAMGLSHSTVDNHKSRLMAKLNIHKAVELAHYALRQGLITLDDIQNPRPATPPPPADKDTPGEADDSAKS